MDIDEFAQMSKRPGWLEDDQVGFHMDVDAALSAEAKGFKWDFEPPDTVETNVFDIEWVGEGSSVSDIDRDFYRLYGRFAEGLQFIRRVIEGDRLSYEVVVGTSSHGHTATFRITGERAAGAAKRYARGRDQPG